MIRSKNPVVMITGASRGFGAALVKQFAENNYTVLATARKPPSQSASNISWYTLDVSNYNQCASAISFGYEKFGQIDILINNASGYSGGKTIADVPKEEIDREIDITLKAPIHLSKLYVDKARSHRSGKIIFISSTAALAREPGCELYSIYSAAKAGLIRFTECLNADIASHGMQAHVVVPCNMRDLQNINDLAKQKAVSYDAAAKFFVSLTQGEGNLSLENIVLNPQQIINNT